MPHVFPNEEGNGLILLFSRVEYDLLKEMPAQLRDLIEDPDFTKRAVARLLPAAYEDPEINQEFMTYAGDDIRDRKLEHVAAFEKHLADATTDRLKREFVVRLDNEDIDHWLGFTNDMRLMVGTDLGIDSNTWYEENAERLAEDRRLWLYEFLTQLQSLLLYSLEE